MHLDGKIIIKSKIFVDMSILDTVLCQLGRFSLFELRCLALFTKDACF